MRVNADYIAALSMQYTNLLILISMWCLP